jgi:hypothetical protein
MRHADKIYSVDVQLNFPPEWGNVFQLIDVVDGLALHDVIWRNFARWISLSNQGLCEEKIAHIEDLTNGFDTHGVRASVANESWELTDKTIEAMEKALRRAYMEIPYRKRKLAKDQTPA